MTDQFERQERLGRSAARGEEAAQILSHPLFQEIVAEQIENVTQGLIALPVEANEQRLALVTVLSVLRKFKGQLEQIKDGGAFDARQLAKEAANG